MLKTNSTQSAENSPLSMDGAKDTKDGSKTSFTTRLAKNSPLNITEDIEVGGNGDNGDNETVKRSPLSKKPNIPTKYFTSPYSWKRWVFLDSFGYGWGS